MDTSIRSFAWVTDPHFPHLGDEARDRFIQELDATPADAFVWTGDIDTAVSLADTLRELAERIARPHYFVLGNHDFYGGSVSEVRSFVRTLVERVPNLYYLSELDPLALGSATGLVGHDGWGDARCGNWSSTLVALNDFRLIEDLAARLWRPSMIEMLRQLGDQAAMHLARVLPLALEQFGRVYVATHVPPFVEAAWHEGKPSNADWAPYFVCRAVGDLLLRAAEEYPDREIVVLCGHTHGEGEFRAAENLVVHTGGSVYGSPRIQRVFDVG